jgi:hypothetical protein
VPIIEKALAAKLPAAMQPGMVVDHHAHGLASQVDRIQSNCDPDLLSRQAFHMCATLLVISVLVWIVVRRYTDRAG